MSDGNNVNDDNTDSMMGCGVVWCGVVWCSVLAGVKLELENETKGSIDKRSSLYCLGSKAVQLPSLKCFENASPMASSDSCLITSPTFCLCTSIALYGVVLQGVEDDRRSGNKKFHRDRAKQVISEEEAPRVLRRERRCPTDTILRIIPVHAKPYVLERLFRSTLHKCLHSKVSIARMTALGIEREGLTGAIVSKTVFGEEGKQINGPLKPNRSQLKGRQSKMGSLAWAAIVETDDLNYKPGSDPHTGSLGLWSLEIDPDDLA
uniref:Uncharacterized protein n=1 Tax=Wuchereria bancrofti TaxID=6293 RepID=A0AAF5Q138_WUCBA